MLFGNNAYTFIDLLPVCVCVCVRVETCAYTFVYSLPVFINCVYTFVDPFPVCSG